MDIHIQFCTEPISRLQPYPPQKEEYGARVEFYGTVRGSELGETIRGLRYEIYHSMAELQIRRIIEELIVHHPCGAISVVHRHGDVLVGENAIYVGITAAHRKEAFEMLSAFMDRLKQDVPIWKAEVLK